MKKKDWACQERCIICCFLLGMMCAAGVMFVADQLNGGRVAACFIEGGG